MENLNYRIKEALNEKSKYTYDNDVLINKLDIKNKEELDKVEASLTFLRLSNLAMNEQRFSFDYMYYLNLHKYIFQDLYEFAGDIRDENIVKGNTPFCTPQNILSNLKYILEEMKRKALNIKSKEDYIEYLSYYYGELNMVHPFREGNGRTLREYLRQLVECLNKYLKLPSYELNYSNISKELRECLIKGSEQSAVTGDTTILKEFFSNVLQEKIKEIKNDKKI